ncbi:hypothetical protein BH20CHL6_BH20CHL6_18230 [soil metagenome]
MTAADSGGAELRFVDVTDASSFALVPPCADQRFDHRTCDYWEDAERGSKAARPSWLSAAPVPARSGPPDRGDNPFAPRPSVIQDNPFAPSWSRGQENPFAPEPRSNPFAPETTRERPQADGRPRKLALLDRGRGIFGCYARVVLVGGEPAAYCQFGPLSAYPRAVRLRALYPQLPDAPLPAVITCIASVGDAESRRHALRLVNHVSEDLSTRGFSAVEAYPDLTLPATETSAARPPFWQAVGFRLAVDDERFPVMRRELT